MLASFLSKVYHFGFKIKAWKCCESMILRKALTSDIKAINELMKLSKAYWKYDQAFMEVFMAKFAIDESYFAANLIKVLCNHNQIIGFFSFINSENNALELDCFFIHPDYIRQGFGKNLWQACCQAAKEFNVKEFILISDPQAELFYTKMGCKKIGFKEYPFFKNRYLPIMSYSF